MILAVAVALAAVLAAALAVVVQRCRRLRAEVHALRTRVDAKVEPDPLTVNGQDLDAIERALKRALDDTTTARDAAERFRAALDALPQGVVMTGPNGEVLLRNGAARSFVGDRTADALVDEGVRAVARAALLDGHVQRALELYGPPRRTVQLVAQRFDSGVLVQIDDVTERARLEAVRTDFVANISHELRTPIGALALLAETVVDEVDPEVVRRLSEKMVFESHRVARIIEDLLELARIELGEEPQREPVNVGLVVAEAYERVRPLAEARHIEVRVAEPSRRLSMMGDRRQLVSAVANLIENGVKYSDPGSTVEVTAVTDGRSVDLVVVDHGIGIPARDLDRIFERFYRVDRARSRETGGTGLGLAIVRHVAHNHGGEVQVASQEGAGSTFTLRIPAGPGPVAVTIAEAG